MLILACLQSRTLNVLSKILENVCTIKSMTTSVKKSNKLSVCFRLRSETKLCVLNFLNNIDSNSKNEHHKSIMIDLKKAFDTVSHKICVN